jgi:hypothetical protein
MDGCCIEGIPCTTMNQVGKYKALRGFEFTQMDESMLFVN